jgi:hypothetical protein
MPSNLTSGSFYGMPRNPFSYEKVEQISRDITTSWLTLEEITQQLNLFNDESQDTYLSGLELATRMAIEDYLGMSIFPITYKAYYGATNNAMGMQTAYDLPEVSQGYKGQCGNTIICVAYYNNANKPVLTTIDPAEYYYDPSANRVIVNTLPNDISTSIANPIVITWQTKANPLSAYPVIKQAGLMLLVHLYNNRSTVGDTVGMKAEIPFGVSTLLRPYKPLVM